MTLNFAVLAMTQQALAGSRTGECYPVTVAVMKTVESGKLDRTVPVFVEEPRRCGELVVVPAVPEGVVGREALTYVLTEVGRQRNEAPYVLASRDDAWVIFDSSNADRLLDVPVTFSAAEYPTVPQVLQALPRLLHGRTGFATLPGGREAPSSLSVVDVPLLEALRALDRQHEGSVPSGWALLDSGFFRIVDVASVERSGAQDLVIGGLPASGELPEALLKLGEVRTDPTTGLRYIASTREGPPPPPRPTPEEQPPPDPRAPRLSAGAVRYGP